MFPPFRLPVLLGQKCSNGIVNRLRTPPGYENTRSQQSLGSPGHTASDLREALCTCSGLAPAEAGPRHPPATSSPPNCWPRARHSPGLGPVGWEGRPLARSSLTTAPPPAPACMGPFCAASAIGAAAAARLPGETRRRERGGGEGGARRGCGRRGEGGGGGCVGRSVGRKEGRQARGTGTVPTRRGSDDDNGTRKPRRT